MKDIKRVMACVDLSEYTQLTLEYTLALVKGLKVEILLFNVINKRDIETAQTVSVYLPGWTTAENYIKRLKEERQQKIEEIIEEHFAADKPHTRVLIQAGVPFEAILKAIEKEKVDLVVLGNKGQSNLVGTLHGSNGEKVFRHSPVPVLSVRDRKRFSRNR